MKFSAVASFCHNYSQSIGLLVSSRPKKSFFYNLRPVLEWLLFTVASDLSSPFMDLFPCSRAKDKPLMPNTPQSNQGASDSRAKCYPIHALIASQSLSTFALTIRQDNGVLIINATVHKVENIPAEHGCQNHTSPVL